MPEADGNGRGGGGGGRGVSAPDGSQAPSNYFHPPPSPGKAVSGRFLSRPLDKRPFFAAGFGIFTNKFLLRVQKRANSVDNDVSVR